MLKRLTTLLLLMGFLLKGSSLYAFSLLGPVAGNAAISSWQTTANGYLLTGDIGGVMNRGEGYRWNVPVVTYAFDSSFLDYFGNTGAAQVQSAMTIFNSLTNFSLMSTNLNEYPLLTTRVNFRAQALGLIDLKSTTLRAIVEEFGLTEAERYVFTLRNRTVQTLNNVTYTNYLVIQRNFDPVNTQPSAFVNGTLYTYQLREFSSPNYADAVELRADKADFAPTSVSYSAPPVGHYFTGLTRDDIGGLRYLYSTNNVAGERLLTDTSLVVTNSTLFELKTADLGLLTQISTNTLLTPAQIQTTFPGIQFTSISTNLALVSLTNVTGSNIVITPTVTNVYTYNYGNVVTNFSTNQAQYSLRTVEVTSNQFGFTTNILSVTNYTTNETAGSFYIITQGLFGYEILEPFYIATNQSVSIFLTNYNTSATITNTSPQSRVIIRATNDLYEMSSFTATNSPANVLARYPGLLITGTNLFLTNYISVQYFSYITNYYTDPASILGRLVVGSNYFTNVITGYSYTFGNVVTNQSYTKGYLTETTISVDFSAPSPYSPAGTVTNVSTNITSSTSLQSFVNGTFYIVPTNIAGYNIIDTQTEGVVQTSNVISSVSANFGTGINLSNIVVDIRYRTNQVLLGEPILVQNPTNIVISATGIRQELVRTSTNVTFKARALQLQNSATTGVVVRRGTDRIRFVGIPYDSVLGQVITPITNYFANDLSVTNGTNIITVSAGGVTNLYKTSGYSVSGTNYDQVEQRVVTTPDFLFAAEDLGLVTYADGSQAPFLFSRGGTANWQNNDTVNGTTLLAGPGVIRPPVTISYNNIGPVATHQTPYYLDQTRQLFINFTWGSFDGSGSEPVVYPVGTDINALESLILSGP